MNRPRNDKGRYVDWEPTTEAEIEADDVRSFWSRVDSDGPNGCWIWLGGTDNHGYGRFNRSRRLGGTRTVTTHRFLFQIVKGVIPDDQHLDHLCRNPPCCNPSHLEPVTPAENRRRAAAYITHCRQGHPLSGDNLLGKGPARKCRACNIRYLRERRARLRNVA